MDFDNSFLDSVLEGAEEAIDVTLDAVQEQEAEIEDTISTDVDDSEIDSIIGDDGKGSSALISDEDIEKIDSGRDPDFDMIDADASKGAKDREIDALEKDAEDGSIITKNEIKNLKEGYDILDFTGDVLNEEFDLLDSEDAGIEVDECPVCHCSPCICKEKVNMFSHSGEDGKARLLANNVGNDNMVNVTTPGSDFSLHQPMKVEDHDLFDDPTNQDLTGIESDGDTEEIHGNDNHGDDLFSDDDLIDDDDEIPSIPVAPKYNPEEDNEPAGPIQPLTDCKEQNQYGFSFENNNEEGETKMFDDDELLDESFDEDLNDEDVYINESEEEDGFTYSLDEDAEEDYEDDSVFALEASLDDKAEDITGAMDGLDDVDMFNSFEGSGINTKQYGESDFLTGMNKNIDEPSGSFSSQDSLKFSLVDTRPFGKAEDPSISDMLK